MKALTSCLTFVAIVLVATALVAERKNIHPEKGHFIRLTKSDGQEIRAFVAGPVDAKAGVLVVHDYLGISDATEQAVEHFGGKGYLALAIDLYGGKSTTSHEEAVKLMKSLDRKNVTTALQAGLDYLKGLGENWQQSDSAWVGRRLLMQT